jgi:hypothetical protein
MELALPLVFTGTLLYSFKKAFQYGGYGRQSAQDYCRRSLKTISDHLDQRHYRRMAFRRRSHARRFSTWRQQTLDGTSGDDDNDDPGAVMDGMAVNQNIAGMIASKSSLDQIVTTAMVDLQTSFDYHNAAQIMVLNDQTNGDTAHATDQELDDSSTQSKPAAGRLPMKSIIPVVNEVVDPNRELKDICTWFTTNMMLGDATQFQFLRLVISTVNDALDIFCTRQSLPRSAIDFIYKGGNVFRAINESVLDKVPAEVRAILREAYDGAFAKSDADFEVIFYPSAVPESEYDTYFQSLTRVMFAVTCHLRDLINAEFEKYIAYGMYSAQYQKTLLGTPAFIDQFLDAAVFKDSTHKLFGQALTGLSFMGVGVAIDPATRRTIPKAIGSDVADASEDDTDLINAGLPPYVGRRDFIVQRSKEQRDATIVYPTSETPDAIYAYFNDTIRAYRTTHGVNELLDFKLFRLKACFNLYVDGKFLTMGGELVDISMPRSGDTRLRDLISRPRNETLKEYTIQHDNTTFQYRSFSLQELAVDLMDVIFKQQDLPWMNRKYVKRLRRLMFLNLADFLAIQNVRHNELAVLYENIKFVAEECVALARQADWPSIHAAVGKIVEELPSENSIAHLTFTHIADIFDPNSTITTPIEVSDAEDFFQKITSECNIAIRVLTALIDYDTSRVLTQSVLYKNKL